MINIVKKRKICVTHNGSFHADDLFATATLSILNNGNIKVIRTRDQKIFEKGDYVYDVGGENNPERNKFDHHQKGGAGVRENGIPYASFGLVWKKYGEEICRSKKISDYLEQKIVEPIDAVDNGFDITETKIKGILPYIASNVFLSFTPTWKESDKNIDKIFSQQVRKIILLLKREIKVAQDDLDGVKILVNCYHKAKDKKIIITNNNFPRYLIQDTLSKLSEPLYVIYPNSKLDVWKVEAISKNPNTMESRKLFPESWRGYINGDSKLKEITGVSDIIFCHPVGFYLNAKSKEGAITLAKKALLS